MGKNLKGRECGKGICQRKDGKYAARYTAKDGSRKEKHFDTLPEARNWLADAQYEDKHDVHNPSSEMTVDSWFEFWITHLIADLAPNTKRNYRERYRVNIQPVIGSMRLCDVKPMHCKIEQDGSNLCRFYHPSGVYCDGNHVPCSSHERYAHQASHGRSSFFKAGPCCG